MIELCCGVLWCLLCVLLGLFCVCCVAVLRLLCVCVCVCVCVFGLVVVWFGLVCLVCLLNAVVYASFVVWCVAVD